VAELDSKRGAAVAAAALEDAGERGFVRIAVEAKVAMRYAPDPLYGAGLEHQDSGA
jgi:hypothetical protein